MEETSYLQAGEFLVDRLQKIPFLKSFKQSAVRELLNSSKIRQYEPGEILIEEGATERWFYIILFGEVSISKSGKEVARLQHTGDVFGESSLIDIHRRTATVTALKKTYCLAVNAGFLDDLGTASRSDFDAVIYHLLAETLAMRLKNTTEELALAKAEITQLKTEVIQQSDLIKVLQEPKKKPKRAAGVGPNPQSPSEPGSLPEVPPADPPFDVPGRRKSTTKPWSI